MTERERAKDQQRRVKFILCMHYSLLHVCICVASVLVPLFTFGYAHDYKEMRQYINQSTV